VLRSKPNLDLLLDANFYSTTSKNGPVFSTGNPAAQRSNEVMMRKIENKLFEFGARFAYV